ncbi:MAG: FtsH protease activity modulator HflK [Mobilitalea sp.]
MSDELKNPPDVIESDKTRKKRIYIRNLFKKLKISISRKKENAAFNDIKNAFNHINPKKTMIIFAAGAITIYLLTGIYIVNPGEQAVIRRFGAVLPQTVSEGIHYRLPNPIDQVQKVNISEIRRADVGMSLPEHMHQEDTPQALQMITGDENIISSEAIVHYKVKDAAKFLYNVNSKEEKLVRSSVESALVRLIANMAVDDILSTEKVRAQNFVIQKSQQILDEYGAGIQITAFNIQTIQPPEAVAEAFRDVNAAKEDKEKEINDAKGYYNSLIPEARGKANTMITQAEAYQTGKINQATGEAQKFESMLAEYKKNSKIYTNDTTKYRLLLETFDKILPKMKKYIVDSSDGSVDVKLFDPSIIQGTKENLE